MTDLGFAWKGPRMFAYSSKEARVIRTLLRLQCKARWMDEVIERGVQLRAYGREGVKVGMIELGERYNRVKSAIYRLEDRLGLTSTAARDEKTEP